MGSKSRIAKYILPIIQQKMTDYNLKTYVEPFCGGCNVIDKIQAPYRIANDKQPYLIELYKNMCNLSQLPEFVTKEHYNEVKKSYIEKDSRFPDWYIGAVGFFASYNGKFFDGGYAGIAKTKIGTIRNYYDEAKRNFEKQVDNLKNVIFSSGDYRETCSHFTNALVYCDPPYKNTTGYKSDALFNHEDFWDWCRKMSGENIVLISEHTAPPDFECIWEMSLKRTLDNKNRSSCIEKLFQYKGSEENAIHT
jgi:DNA adenine methylase